MKETEFQWSKPFPFLWHCNFCSETCRGFHGGDTGITSCFICPDFFYLSLCHFKFSSHRFYWGGGGKGCPPLLSQLLRSFFFSEQGGSAPFQRGAGTGYVSKALPSCLLESKQERFLVSHHAWHPGETGEMLWSPTMLSLSKVASDTGNLLITGQLSTRKGFICCCQAALLRKSDLLQRLKLCIYSHWVTLNILAVLWRAPLRHICFPVW